AVVALQNKDGSQREKGKGQRSDVEAGVGQPGQKLGVGRSGEKRPVRFERPEGGVGVFLPLLFGHFLGGQNGFQKLDGDGRCRGQREYYAVLDRFIVFENDRRDDGARDKQGEGQAF